MIRSPSEIVAVRKTGLATAVIGLTLVAACVWYWSGWRRSETALSSLRLRVNTLRGHVEKQRAAAGEAVEKYQPLDEGKVDDLGCPVARRRGLSPPSRSSAPI
jgi:hypothetical protein